MATKEDILEQIVEEYLIAQGYFVRHNLKFLPSSEHADYRRQEDSNHSDIDILGYNPKKQGPDRVWAVSCKSWQDGFSPRYWLGALRDNKKISGRPAWKAFRELQTDKWSTGFIEAVNDATGTRAFTHVLAVAKLRNADEVEEWVTHPQFRQRLGGNPLKIITFREMVTELKSRLSSTLAGSEVGRLLQMFAAAGL